MGGGGRGKAGKSWPRGGHSPYGKGTWASADPFTAIADSIDGAMNSAQSMARITQLGQLLAGISGQQSNGGGAGNNQAEGQGAAGKTSSMSAALLGAINTQNQVAVTAQSNVPDIDDMLQKSKAFASMNNRVSGLEEQMITTNKSIENMASQQGKDSLVLRQILDKISGPSTGGPPAAAEAGAAVAAGVARAPVAAVPEGLGEAGDDDVNRVDQARHTWFCGKFGISTERRDLQGGIFDGLNTGDGTVGYEAWAAAMARTKTGAQWKAKLKTLQVQPEAMTEVHTVDDVMSFIKDNLWEDM
eukprot:TRINITY_DN6399_c0_g1_i1.p1 TRINITY_DN6399_c0_g1~~TRINITY_DN6399_c0_g1_i1.p1  ORF type:complete len:301 (-),score=76.31 TRINITY_DN6399_c0_g1_i1:590-1492(-)